MNTNQNHNSSHLLSFSNNHRLGNYFVIGASSGIGRATALELAKDNVVFGTYNLHEPEATTGVSYHPLNVLADMQEVSFLPDVLDGVVYCPGSIQLKPFARLKPEDFMNDYALQLVGAVKMLQAVLPRLKAAEKAAIVLFSTVAVQTGFNFHTVVAASKGAVEGFAKALAAELAPKIRVNCIAPSITETPLAGTLLNTPEKKDANAQRHPLKKIGQPEDIARLAAFLVTDQSGWITGQVIHADGGMGSIRL